jgi:hypothetical protein
MCGRGEQAGVLAATGDSAPNRGAMGHGVGCLLLKFAGCLALFTK